MSSTLIDLARQSRLKSNDTLILSGSVSIQSGFTLQNESVDIRNSVDGDIIIKTGGTYNNIPFSSLTNSDITAENISYDNFLFSSITNVKQALDATLTGTYEVFLNITSPVTPLFELGQTVTSVILNWSSTRDITAQTLNNGIGAIPTSLRSFVHSPVAITSTTTYTLIASAINESSALTRSQNINFGRKIYFGISSNDYLSPTHSPTDLSSFVLTGLSNSLQVNFLSNNIFNTLGSNFYYYAIPSAFGIPVFKDKNGFILNGLPSTSITITNSFGFNDNYRVFRSHFKQNSTGTTVILS